MYVDYRKNILCRNVVVVVVLVVIVVVVVIIITFVVVVLVKALKKKLGEANHILTTMAEQRKRWKEKLQVSCSHLDSVPGHAMLCAAGACYLSRIPLYLHKELQANWLGYCSGTISLGSVSQDRGKLQAAQVSNP